MTELEIREKKIKKRCLIISIASVVAFFSAWYVATAVLHLMPDYCLPSPLQVLEAFICKFTTKAPDNGTIFQHILASLKVALSGYALGAVVGIPLGICMAWYEKVDLIVTPIFDLLRPVPTIAWIPLMIVWFGIGLGAKAAIIFVSAFIPCVINAYAGIKQTKAVHLWVAQTFGASRNEMLFTVAIPTALPLIFTGLRLSLQAAWTTLCAAEMLAANRGLGYMIQLNRMLARADLILVGMITIGMVGSLLSILLTKIEKIVVKGGRI